MSYVNNENNVQNTEEVTKDSSYYNNLYLSLDAKLNTQSSLAQRVETLSQTWSVVRQLCLHSICDTNKIVCWIQQHTARTVLERERSPSIKAGLKKLEASLDTFTTACKADNRTLPWEKELLQKVAWFKNLLVDAWNKPILNSIERNKKTKKHDYKKWLKQEGGVIFAERVMYLLLTEKMRDLNFAQNYVTAFINTIRDEQTDITDEEYLKDDGLDSNLCSFETELKSDALFDQIWDDLVDLEYILLYKSDCFNKIKSYDQMKILIDAARVIPLKRGLDVVTRLLNKPQGTHTDRILWKDAGCVAHIISQVLLLRYVQVPRWRSAAERAVRSLVGALVRIQRYTPSLNHELGMIAPHAANVTHLVTLRDAIEKQGATAGMTPESIKLCEEAVLDVVTNAEKRKYYSDYKERETRAIKTSYKFMAYREYMYVTHMRYLKIDELKECSMAKTWRETPRIWFVKENAKILKAIRSDTAQCSQGNRRRSPQQAQTNLDSNRITYDESNERTTIQSSSQIPTTDKRKDTSNADKNSREQIKTKTKDRQMPKRKVSRKASPIDESIYSSSDGDTPNEEDNNMTDKSKDNYESDKNSLGQVKRKTRDKQMPKRKVSRKASSFDDSILYSSSERDILNEEDNNIINKSKHYSGTAKNSHEQVKRKTRDRQMPKRKVSRKDSPIDDSIYLSSDGDTSNEEDNNITDKSKDNCKTDKNSREQVERKTKERQMPKRKVTRKASPLDDSILYSSSDGDTSNKEDNNMTDKSKDTSETDKNSHGQVKRKIRDRQMPKRKVSRKASPIGDSILYSSSDGNTSNEEDNNITDKSKDNSKTDKNSLEQVKRKTKDRQVPKRKVSRKASPIDNSILYSSSDSDISNEEDNNITDKSEDNSETDNNSCEQVKRKTKDKQIPKRKVTRKASPIDNSIYLSSDGDTPNEEDNNMTDKSKDNSETDKNSHEQVKRKTKDRQVPKRKVSRKASPLDDSILYSSSDGDTSNKEDNNMTDKSKDTSETDKNSHGQVKRKIRDRQMPKRKVSRKASPIGDSILYSSSDGNTSNEEDNNITDKSKDNSKTDKNSLEQVKRKTKDRQVPKRKVSRKASPIDNSILYSSSDSDISNEEDNNMTDKSKDNSETYKNSRGQVKRKTKDRQVPKRKVSRKASPLDDSILYSSSVGDTPNEEDMTDKSKDNSETYKNSRGQVKRKTKDRQIPKRKVLRKASPIDDSIYSLSEREISNEEDNNMTDKSKDNSEADKNSHGQVKRKTKDRQIPKRKVLREASLISDSLSLSNDRNVNILSQNQEINRKDDCNAGKNLETQDKYMSTEINDDSLSSTSDSDSEVSSFDEEIKTLIENTSSDIFKILMKRKIKVNSPIFLFQCKKCSVNFSSKSHFLMHLPDCRFDIDTYDCKTCGLKFPLLLKEKHLRMHKGKQNLCFNVLVEV